MNVLRINAYIFGFYMIIMIVFFDPKTMASQEILAWEWCTMEVTYWRIGNAIQQHRLGTHSTACLMFFCLGRMKLNIVVGMAL